MDAQSGGEEVGNTGTAVGGRGRTSSAGMGSSGHRSRAGPARESHALQRGRLGVGRAFRAACARRPRTDRRGFGLVAGTR
jgi:hypothetical protein